AAGAARGRWGGRRRRRRPPSPSRRGPPWPAPGGGRAPVKARRPPPPGGGRRAPRWAGGRGGGGRGKEGARAWGGGGADTQGGEVERRRRGVPVPRGGGVASRVAACVLEVLAGVRTPAEAAGELAVSLPRYYQLEQRALQGLVRGCEPPPRGRVASPEGELAR